MNAPVTTWPKASAVEEQNVPPRRISLRPRETGMLPVFTLVIWAGCVTIGITGFLLPYLRPERPAKVPPPVTAELLKVELTSELAPPATLAPPPPDLMQPPPLVKPDLVPPAPPLVQVAAPSPQIAFAVPVEAARIVPVKEASYRTAELTALAPAPATLAPQPLTFGQGEGKQPAPEYPRQALREGQEGVVTVRMTVGEDGRVVAAEASAPSPWPLLNTAAVRVVKSRWRFASGPLRAYEVAIHFQLTR